MTLAVSSHGTLIAYQPTPGGAYTTIAELGDIDLPGLMRNEFDATTQDKDIDSWVLGVLRRNPFTVPVNFLPTDPTHDHLTGLQKLIIDNTVTGFRVTFPVAAGVVVWLMSGQVKEVASTAPVDGKLAANVSIRFSGPMAINSLAIG